MRASKAFEAIGVTPRDQQAAVVDQIITAFREGKKNVLLDAPTGSGKSYIAAAVAEAMSCRSVITTATNTLAGQYQRDFERLGKYAFVYGAGNYSCDLRKQLFEDETATAERCYRKSKFFHGAETPIDDSRCGDCRFRQSRRDKAELKTTVTNYSYFILDRLYISTMEGANCFDADGLFVFDEAHLINEMFAGHSTIFFSERRSREYLDDCSNFAGEGAASAYTNVFRIITENCRRGSISESNAPKFMRMLMKFYAFMMEVTDTKAGRSSSEGEYDRLKMLHRKYHGLFCKIDDAIKYNFELAVTVDRQEASVSIKPVFVKDTFQKLSGKHNLMMSATLEPHMMMETLCLDPEETEIIRVPYSFNHDDKVVVVPKRTVRLNMSSMSDEGVLKELSEICDEILGWHPEEKGTISTTSFKLASEIADRLQSKAGHRVFLHSSGIRSDAVINEFKEHVGPAVIISPSLFEGVDLAGDQSRSQVITKCPFYSLGDRRNKIISMRHRPVYNSMTTVRLVQALGRSTRFKGDRSVSYLVDKNAATAFRSKHNRWKEQFKVFYR